MVAANKVPSTSEVLKPIFKFKKKPILSITMHCLDENFCRHDMVLATLCMDGLRHSGENIAERITECLAKNDFALNKIACCVRDDARNMQSAAKELDTER